MSKQKIKIPEGWKEIKLGEIIKFQGGFAFKTSDYKDGGIPLVRIGNVGKGYFEPFDFVYLSKESFNEQKQFQLQVDDILMGMTGDLGKVCKIREKYLPALLNQRVGRVIIKNKKEVNNNFIYQLFLSSGLQSKFEKHFEGMAQKNISPGQIESVEILLPPLATQNKIAEILGVVDEEIEKVEKIIKNETFLLKGTMNKILNVGKELKIGSVCVVNPEQIDPRQKEMDIFKYIDIASIEDLKILEVKNYLGSEIPSRARRVVKNNDILISTVRPNLKASTILKNVDENNLLCSTGFCVLRTKKEFDSNYLYYKIIDDNFVKYLVNKTTGSNYPSVSAGDIKEYKTKFPNFEEQQKIAGILSLIDNKISIYKNIKNNLIQLKKGLTADLLSGKVKF